MAHVLPASPITFCRRPQVTQLTGLPESTLYEHTKRRLFMRPVRLGRRTVGWPRHEIEAINAARLRGATDDEIRALVVQLEAARKRDGTEG
jgi:prophage regulatory protein